MDYPLNELIDMIYVLGDAGKSPLLAQRIYRMKYPERRIPTAVGFRNVMDRFDSSGSVKYSKREVVNKKAANEDNELEILLNIQENPQIPKTSFSCDGRTSGYYADVSTGCQVYHMCDGLGRQFSYQCPSKTLFQQRMLICDHWYMVNCSKAEEDYSANLLIGQREKAFIEDLEYRRTPRPDLVDPGNADYNTYRIGQQEIQSTKNVVGADGDNDAKANTDDSHYFPPSRWSTVFSLGSTTPSNTHKREESDTMTPGLVKQVFYMTNYNTVNKEFNNDDQPKGKAIDFSSINRNDNAFNTNSNQLATKDNINKEESLLNPQLQQSNVPTSQGDESQENNFPGQVNFPSRFKATTPVYPKHVEVDQSKFFEFGDPIEQNAEDEVSVNFPSKFKATTPVYPKQVPTDPSRLSEFDIPFEQIPVEPISVNVNFPSKFKATTPVYPTHVEFDPSKLSEFDILPNEQENAEFVSVNFPSKFRATTPVYPKHVDLDLSKFSGSEEIPPGQNQEESVVVNFGSSFKATTPVYPTHVEFNPSKLSEFDILPNEQENAEFVSVNFPSKFRATTPVYPKHVDLDLSKFSGSEEIPPVQNQEEHVVVNFGSRFKATTPVNPTYVGYTGTVGYPSKLSEFDTLPNKQENAEFVSVNFPSKFRATTPVYPKHVDLDLSKFSGSEEIPPGQNQEENVVVNFASNFKATTPVYPKQVDVDLSKFLEPVELPLIEDNPSKNGSVNFASNFQATTPVYPQTVEPTSPIPDEAGLLPPFAPSELQSDVNQAENRIHVNFASNFQATTPNYPTSVEPTSPDPNEVGLVVPQLNADEQDPDIPSLDIQPPNFARTFSRRSDEHDPTVVGNTFNSKQLTEFMITMKPEQLKDLKELWHIPDYDFPLESASIPSYSSDFSSFQAKPINKR